MSTATKAAINKYDKQTLGDDGDTPIYDPNKGMTQAEADAFRSAQGQYSNYATPAGEYGELYTELGSSQYDEPTLRSITDPSGVIRNRADMQPWTDQLGNFLNQAVVGEILGGTMMSIGALVDPKAALNTLTGTEENFTNAIYELGDNLSKWSREATPIYQTGDRFTDTGWWFSNGVSIASSLSMLVPGMGVAAGLKTLSGMAGLSTIATELISTLGGSVAMRHAENFREASDIFKTNYDKAFATYQQQGDSYEDADMKARDLASKVAAKDYKMNYANLAFDIIQLGSVMKAGSSLKGLTRDLGLAPYSVAKAAGILPKKAIGKAGYWMAENILPQATEALEEGINTLSQFEANRTADIKLGKIQDDGTTLLDRIPGYLGTAEMQDSMMWGMAGGLAFHALGSAIEGNKENAARLKELALRPIFLKSANEQIEAIVNKRTEKNDKGEIIYDYSNLTEQNQKDKIEKVREEMVLNYGFSAASAQNSEVALNQLETEQFKKDAIAQGWTTEEQFETDKQLLKDGILKAEEIVQRARGAVKNSKLESKLKDSLESRIRDVDEQRELALMDVKRSKEAYNKAKDSDPYLRLLEEQGKSIENFDEKMQLYADYVIWANIDTEINKANAQDKLTSVKNLKALKEKAAARIKAAREKGITTEELVNKINQRMLDTTIDRIVDEHTVEIATEEISNMINPDKQQEYVDKKNAEALELKKETEKRQEWRKKVNKSTEQVSEEDLKQYEELKKTGQEHETLLHDLAVKKAVGVALKGAALKIYNENKANIDARVKEINKQKPSSKYAAAADDLNDDDINLGAPSEFNGDFSLDAPSTSPSKETVAHDKYRRAKSTGTKLSYQAVTKANPLVFNPDLLEPLLMHHSEYQPMTQVTLEVDMDMLAHDDVKISIDDYNWVVSVIKNNTPISDTDKIKFDKLVGSIPIAVKKTTTGKKIAYIHSQSWITNKDENGIYINTGTGDAEGSAADAIVQEQVDKNRAMRIAVLKEGRIETRTLEKSHGVLMKHIKDKDGNIKYNKSSEIFSNELPIVITKKNNWHRNKSNVFSDTTNPIINDANKMVEGQPAVVVKTANGSNVALPIAMNKLDTRYVDTIMRALEVFHTIVIKGDKKNIPALKFAEEIKKFYGKKNVIDITTFKGMKSFLSQFIDLTHFTSDNLGDDYLAWTKGDIKGEAVRVVANEKEIMLYRVSELVTKSGVIHATVNLGKLDNFKEVEKYIRELLSDKLANANLDMLSKANFSIPLVQEDGMHVKKDPNVSSYKDFILQNSSTNVVNQEVTLANGKKDKVYFVHSVITLDDSFATPKEDAITTTETEEDFETTEDDEDILILKAPSEYKENRLSPEAVQRIRESGNADRITGPIWNAFRVNTVVSNINKSIIQALRKGRKNKRINISNALDYARKEFEQIQKNLILSGNAPVAKMYDEILSDENWHKFSRLALQELISTEMFTMRDKNNKKIRSIDELEEIVINTNEQKEEFDSEAEGEVNSEEGEYLRSKQFNDMSTMALNPSKHVQNKLKWFLGFIEDKDGLNQDIILAKAGFKSYKSFKEILRFLSDNLMEIEPTTEAVMLELQKLSRQFPWVKELYNTLQGVNIDKNSDEVSQKKEKQELDQLKKQLVVLVSKHQTEMMMALTKSYEKRDEDSDYLSNLFEENYESVKPEMGYSANMIDPYRNSFSRLVREEWLNNLLTSGIVSTDENGNRYIDKSIREGLQEIFKEAEDLAKKQTSKGNAELNEVKNEIKIILSNLLKIKKKDGSFSSYDKLIIAIYNNYESHINAGLSSESYFKNNLSEDIAILVKRNKWTLEQDAVELVQRAVRDKHDAVDENNIAYKAVEYLTQLGIQLHPKAVQELFSGNLYADKKRQSIAYMFSPSGILGIINGRLSKASAQDVGSDERISKEFEKYNPMSDNSGIKALTKLQAKYVDKGGSRSFRNSKGNLIQSATIHRNVTLQMMRLRNNKNADGTLNEHIKGLAKSDFTKVDILLAESGQTLSSEDTNSKWLMDLINNTDEYADNFKIKWQDGLRNDETGKNAVTLAEMSPREFELMKLYAYHTKGKYAYFFLPSSERNMIPSIPGLRINTVLSVLESQGEIKLNTETINALEQLFRAEAERINRAVDLKSDPESRIHKAAGYTKGSSLFMFFPELNKKETIPGLISESGKVNLEDSSIMEAVYKHFEQVILSLVEDKLNQWKKLGILNEDGTLQHIPDSVKTDMLSDKKLGKTATNEEVARGIATEFVVNQFIANGNMIQLFAGDPAIFYKAKKGYTTEQAIASSWDNFSKRMNKASSPKTDLADAKGKTMTMLKIKDHKGSIHAEDMSKILNLLGQDIVDKYNGADHTDAQVYTTGIERLDTLFHEGIINESEYNTIKDKLINDKDLTDEELGTMMHPQKHVYVGFVYDDELKTMVPMFEKSSDFPLLRQFTKGLEIDKLRMAMEGRNADNTFHEIAKGKEGNFISRLAHDTAIKSDATDAISVYTEDGRIPEDIDLNIFDNNKQILNREDFGKQQEVPFSEGENEITKGAQEAQNIIADIPDDAVMGELSWKPGKLSGKEVKDKYQAAYVNLYKLLEEEFLNDIGYNEETGEVSITKLRDRLDKEVLSKGYPKDVRDMIQLVRNEVTEKIGFIVPLWSLGFSDKFQFVLNSIVSNNVTKIKMPGFSAVLGANTGFKTTKSLKEYDPKDKNDIVWLPGFDGNEQLKDNQIIAPSKFVIGKELINLLETDDKGKYVWLIEDPETKVKRLNLEKFSPELLQLFSYRIPNQGKNMMASIEIVGFVPKAMGDLVIAPSTFITRMGSDFDIDKLYNYMYHHKFENGKFMRDDSTKIKQLQNEIIDYHHMIMNSPNKEIQKLIYEPLTEGRIENLADEVISLRKQRSKETADNNHATNYLYDQIQTDIYMNGRASDTAISAFAVAVKFNSLAQGKTIRIKANGEEDAIIFGKNENNNVVHKATILSIKETLPLNRLHNQESVTVLHKKANESEKDYYERVPEHQRPLSVSSVLSGLLSTALDDFKKKFMHKINLNKQTLSAYTAMATLGLDVDYAVMLSNQDIVLEYTRRVQQEADSFSVRGITAAKNKIAKELFDKYWKLAGKEGEYDRIKVKAEDNIVGNEQAKDELYRDYPLTLTDMVEMIRNESYGNYDYDFNMLQIIALEKFMQAQQIGDNLSDLNYTINTDSKNIPRDLYEVQSKMDKVFGLSKRSDFFGAHKLLGNFEKIESEEAEETTGTEEDVAKYKFVPTTIPGAATYHGLWTAQKLWSSHFLYNKPFFKNLVRRIVKESRTGVENKKGDDYRKVERFIKAYINSSGLGLFNTTAREQRERLFFAKSEVKEMIENGQTVHKRVWINKPLAQIVEEAKKVKGMENNAFLQALYTVIDANGVIPSKILMNKGAEANTDKTEIREGFKALFGDETPIFENYTLSDLAEELVTAAYISGDVSSYTDYLEYVPFQYLVEKGVAKNLRTMDLFEGWITDKAEADRIIDAYYDHYPEQGFAFNEKEEKKKTLLKMHSRVNGIPTFLTLNEEEAKAQKLLKLVKDDKGNESWEPVKNRISLKQNNRYFPYKLVKEARVIGDGADAQVYSYVYQRQDKKGHKGFLEIDAAATEETPSLIRENRSNITQVSDKENSLSTKAINNLARQTGKYSNGLQGKDALNTRSIPINNKGTTTTITNTLNNIKENSSNDGFRLVAGLFSDALKNIGTKITFDSTSDNLIEWDGSENILHFSSKRITNEGHNINKIDELFLHEVGHAVTADLVKRYFLDKSTLTSKQREAVSSLRSLFSNLKEKIKKGEIPGIDAEIYKEFSRVFKKYTKEKKQLTEEEQALYETYYKILYPFVQEYKNNKTTEYVGISELITQTLSDSEFQQFLNSIEYRTNKTALEQFLKVFKKLFEAMSNAIIGGIRKDSALEESMYNVLLLVTPEADTSQTDKQSSTEKEVAKIITETDKPVDAKSTSSARNLFTKGEDVTIGEEEYLSEDAYDKLEALAKSKLDMPKSESPKIYTFSTEEFNEGEKLIKECNFSIK